ncbi:MAG: glutamate--tRNA ligase [Planctomycetaceae bacterium]|nr:glutamate--tRNA ligase [Planctomycetaceae bacterium]
MRVRTRFAPSPTGYLHIGGVRTALFNYLFAKQHGGQFILRIDDTDQQRNVEEALAPILDGLRWLGIDWDEGPGKESTDVRRQTVADASVKPESSAACHLPSAVYYQSQRSEKYQAAVNQLIAKGFAYNDYALPEEIQAERDAAVAEKRTFVYSRKFMAQTKADKIRFENAGRSAVVRLKMPREGKLVIDDLVRGKVEFDWANEQDHVIQRADGSFIYHLANVVDDEDFEISHVIRAEEHLSNTPRQIFMIQALGYRLPQYAHLPFVAEPGSKTKLSKRKLDKYLKNKDFADLVEHGNRIAQKIGLETTTDGFNPVIVDFYKQVGYLPEAIVNYLALLGWSLDDKTEFFTMEDLTRLFSIDRVIKGAASFDAKKLFAFQEMHMQKKTVDEKYELCLPFLQKAGLLTLHSPLPAFTRELISATGERIRVSGDILDFADFFDDAFPYDEKALEKRITSDPAAKELLAAFREKLSQLDAAQFEPATLEKVMGDFLEEKQIKVGQIIHAVRVATTGKAVGLGLFETLAILGKVRVLARIGRTLNL